MKKKAEKIKKVIEKKCMNRVMVCTPKFCATGCYDDEFSDDYIVSLSDVKIEYNDGAKEQLHKDTMCICDDYIIAFEPLKSE
ncbi:MAG: hypothetical protein PHV37_01280 [Candidatus Gastranaerophilales bacterium]|nr:hypothetical protein [Candidatus Gastranaerophilales bacterium]